MIPKGIHNKQASNILRTGNSIRQPITVEIMLSLKRKLRDWATSHANQRLIWATATCMYHGLFRVQELLCDREDAFDPAFTLLTTDIQLNSDSQQDSLQFNLKAPKEDKKCRSKIVDVYSNGTPTCPVRAFTKWKAELKSWPPTQPAFRWDDGTPLTARCFNKILKDKLADAAPNPHAKLSSHSFRIGAASRLGELGHSDDDLKAMGRWSSRAFEEYLLHPRTKRAAIAKNAL